MKVIFLTIVLVSACDLVVALYSYSHGSFLPDGQVKADGLLTMGEKP